VAGQGLTVWFLLPVGVASVVLILVLLFLGGRRQEVAIERDWELVLTQRGQRKLDAFTEDVKAELALSELTYDRAREARDRGDLEAARKLIDSGCELIAAYAPRMHSALAAMSALSRMAAAVAPVRPLRAERFHLSQLVQLAHVGRLLHHLAASTADRFRLRVHILQRGFGVVAKVALRWRTAPPELLDAVGALHHDVGVLSDESLVTLKALLVSMDAERRDVSRP
jgi:hypothetical protein